MTVSCSVIGIRPTIRVELIGAGNWALRGHLPVLRLLLEYEIAAIQSRSDATRLKIPHILETAEQVARHPDVDLAAFLTAASQHAAGVRAALVAGKDVCAEWPLSTSTALSKSLVSPRTAESATLSVCSEGFRLPTVASDTRSRTAMSAELRSARLHVSMNRFQATLPRELLWTVPPETFPSMTAIFAGHFLDALFAVVGQPADLTALIVNQFSEITIIETSEKIKTTNPEEVAVTGTLVSGGVCTAHLEGAKRNGSGVQIGIAGAEGDLQITNTAAFGDVGDIKSAHGDNLPGKCCLRATVTIGCRRRSCVPPSSNSRTSTSPTPATFRPERVSLPYSRTRSECTPSSI